MWWRARRPTRGAVTWNVEHPVQRRSSNKPLLEDDFCVAFDTVSESPRNAGFVAQMAATIGAFE